MKSLLGSLLIISMAGCASGASTDTIKEVRPKVVELHITNREPAVPIKTKKRVSGIRIEQLPSGSLCTGAVVSPDGFILTARHCVDDAASIQVTFSDEKSYDAVVVATSTRHDLALIHVDRFHIPFFTLAKSLEQGQHIWVMGNPVGVIASLSD